MSNEVNTCRKYVKPKLNQVGWNTAPYDYEEEIEVESVENTSDTDMPEVFDYEQMREDYGW